MAANYDSFQNHCHLGHRCSSVYSCWMRHFWGVKSGEMFRRLSTWDATICERITDHSFLLIFIKIFEMRKVYDGSDASDVQCQVSRANEGRNCNVSYYWTRSTHTNVYMIRISPVYHSKLNPSINQFHAVYIRIQWECGWTTFSTIWT